MSQLITLAKGHPDFEKYLLGTFSQEQRALPITSLNVNTASEQVTFKIVNKSEIAIPSFFEKWIVALKVRNFTMVLFPMFLILVKAVVFGDFINPLLSLMACIGVTAVHASVNLRNDFYDHVYGHDRINSQVGSRAIQEGWVTAAQVKRLSWTMRIIGIALGLPAIVYHPNLLYLAVPAVFMTYIKYSPSPNGFYYRRWNEVTAFFLLGPFLTASYEIVVRGSLSWEAIWIGVLCGWLAVFNLHLRNFEHIVVQSQAAFSNAVNRLGFDRSKKLLMLWWLGFLILFYTYHEFYVSTFWTTIGSLFLGMASIPFFVRVSSMESPVGSILTRVVRRGQLLYFTAVTIWFVENIWYWIVKYAWVQ